MLDWRIAIERRFRAARLVYGHGTTNARGEAAWLVAHAARVPFAALDAEGQRIPNARVAARIMRIARARVSERVPLAYLLGEAWLGGYRFHVNRRVIVPRSFIAPMLAERLAPWITQPTRIRRVLDMCTGSGCLAILAAHAFPRATVDAVDLSAAALTVARRNIRAHRLASRVQAIRSNLFEGLQGRRYDLIIANPPYVTARNMRVLPQEYRAEPALALAGGPDGLDLVRRLLDGMRAHLRPGGMLLVEIGRGRAQVERAFPDLPLVWLDDAVFLYEP